MGFLFFLRSSAESQIIYYFGLILVSRTETFTISVKLVWSYLEISIEQIQ